MSEFKKVFIFGYSGHAFVLIESMMELGFSILGYFDKMEAISNPYNLQYFGYELNVNVNSVVENHYVFPAVGEQHIRERIVSFFISKKLNQFILIDNTARVSKTASIGLSTYIGKNSNINALCNVGKGVIVNTSAVVEHECQIGDFVHIAPSATLAGNVKVGNNSFVGANSVAKQNIIIGSNCILGAGSVLVRNLPDNETWIGNPAKRLNK